MTISALLNPSFEPARGSGASPVPPASQAAPPTNSLAALSKLLSLDRVQRISVAAFFGLHNPEMATQTSLKLLGALLLRAHLVNHHGQVAGYGPRYGCQPLCSAVDHEHDLRHELLLRRHVRKRLDVFNGDDFPLDDARFEREHRAFLRPLRHNFGQGHRVVL